LTEAADRSGRVLNFFLARSSGDSTLDAEVLAMIERASPLPAPPLEVDDSNLHLLVPVQFSIR
jgi:periplasmic protein TonB